MSIIHQRGPASIRANLTPMIDVTFLLIVFFVLVSQIVEVENVKMLLPELEEPATELFGDEQRAVINVVPDARGGAKAYRLGAREYPAGEAGADAVSRQLAHLLRSNPGLSINLRADRATHYEFVQPMLQAVARAADRTEDGRVAPRVNLVVLREE
jgi:biopolymer transport protein ExbD